MQNINAQFYCIFLEVKSQMKHKPARQSTSSSSMEPPSPVEQDNIQDEQEQIDVVNVGIFILTVIFC